MLSEYFAEVTAGDWITAGLDVQYKVVNRVLYFQCSSGQSDWRENFKEGVDVYPCPDVPFKAHRGFSELWRSVRADIGALDFTTIVGYSQGAALALFAHENYHHRFGVQPRTILFGCPRLIYKPGDDIAERFTEVTRVKNPGDIVTHVPFWLAGYRHVGYEHKLTGPARRPKGVPILVWYSHHSPFEYAQRLKGL